MVFFHNSNSAHRPLGVVVDSLIGERVLDKPMLLPTPRGLAICWLRYKKFQLLSDPLGRRADRTHSLPSIEKER